MPISCLPDRAIAPATARAVGAQQVVRGDRRLEQIAVAGRERAVEIAAVGHHPRLVERRPPLDAARRARGT